MSSYAPILIKRGDTFKRKIAVVKSEGGTSIPYSLQFATAKMTIAAGGEVLHVIDGDELDSTAGIVQFGLSKEQTAALPDAPMTYRVQVTQGSERNTIVEGAIYVQG